MSLNKLQSAQRNALDDREIWEPDAYQTKTGEATIDSTKYYGYYRTIPELSVIDKMAEWVVYGGDDTFEKDNDITFESDTEKKRFEQWNGYGKDTPKEILYNLFRTGKITGVSAGEIIRIKKKGVVNVKPLDPGILKVKANKRGILENFEITSAKAGADGQTEKIGKELPLHKIFYWAHNRFADEIVGTSTIEKLKTILDYRHQAMEDLAEVFHRYVVPFWIFYVDEDDPDELKDFNTKIEKMISKRDHMTVPKDTVEKHERMSVPQFSTLDPLNWIKHLERYFLLSEGIPEIIAGIGRETADASSRMIILAWRIIVIANQKKFEEQIAMQTGIKLRLPRPINILSPEITGQRSEVPGKSRENKENKDPNG